MVENMVAIASAVGAIALGLMNYFKHKHLEADIKNMVWYVSLELALTGEDMQPEARVVSVERGKRQASKPDIKVTRQA